MQFFRVILCLLFLKNITVTQLLRHYSVFGSAGCFMGMGLWNYEWDVWDAFAPHYRRLPHYGKQDIAQLFEQTARQFSGERSKS